MFRYTLHTLAVIAAPLAQAAEIPPAMSQYIYDDLMKWINNIQIVHAINAQNRQTRDLSETEIITRDAAWRAEIGQAASPFVDRVLNTPLSMFLRERLEHSNGRITEVIVMDHKGLNVAVSNVTSDYWQGDETKFQETFSKGSGAVFIDDIRLDESTQRYQGQVSFSVTDPDTGRVVGAITVGLDASAFF
ncbi:hypothetical protein OS190_09295 [Sulfitobacter sp. F26204]|uniref:hypothetical protein n=1 Tax=Sulfitobacter sp. F26204 TaxID=2996014 RepID=UPI00225DF48A|nr:hypothetical protein [Sulfitobacter sp. F26204]MCX7559761.1 hypothetical protein [Sulfitobacter sp. F26204]